MDKFDKATLVFGNLTGVNLCLGRIIHLAGMRIFLAATQDLESAGPVTPLDDGNLGLPGSPAAHAAEIGVVNVDGVGSNKRGSVVIDDVSMRKPFDLELGADGISGPISSSTTDSAILKIGSEGVLSPRHSNFILFVGKGSGENNPLTGRIRVSRHTMLVFGKTSGFLRD